MGVPWINSVNTRIIPCSFEYYEASSVSEAVKLLTRLGPEAKILAGGTDLLVQIKMGQIKPRYIVNIKRISELRGIRIHGKYLSIGALTRLSDIEKNSVVREKFYALYEAVKLMASPQIRNMATIGGNLCNASPAADTAPPLMVFNALLRITGLRGVREVPITDFFKGPKKTVLKHNELLTEIIIPYPEPNTGSCFIKIARTSMDLAKASVAVKLTISEDDVIDDVRIALGSVAPTPVRAKTVEEFLREKKFSEELVSKASSLVVNDISPITDVRSTAEYRRMISRVIVYDALMEAYRRIKGGGL